MVGNAKIQEEDINALALGDGSVGRIVIKHQLNAPATPNLAKPIVRQVRTEETSSNVTATILPLGGTASQMLLEPECLPPQWRYIIVEPMHRPG